MSMNPAGVLFCLACLLGIAGTGYVFELSYGGSGTGQSPTTPRHDSLGAALCLARLDQPVVAIRLN